MTGRLPSLLLAVLCSLLVAGATPTPDGEGQLIRVPQDHATIQAGVDAATRGDVVLVDAGVWHEQVQLGPEHAGITIRGVDRNAVELDGRGRLSAAFLVLGADDVRIENMTAHDYVAHGFFWQSVEGYVGRYLTAHRIGVYGIYAFDSRLGLFEHVHSSGASDAAIYIGQCRPCDATVRHAVGEYATMGFSGTNASGNLVIEDSQWNFNGAGIVPNSLDSELLPPQSRAVIRRNVVQDSGQASVPSQRTGRVLGGIGILLGGAIDDVVEDNLVAGSRRIGIAVAPQPSKTLWPAEGNVVRRNIVQGTGPGGVDLAIVAEPGSGNCFEQNSFTTSDPPRIELAWACGGGGGESATTEVLLALADCEAGRSSCGPEPTTYDRTPVPGPQPTMPDDQAGAGAPGGPDDQPSARPTAAPTPVVAPTVPVEAAPPVAPTPAWLPLGVAFAVGAGVTGLWWLARLRARGVRLRQDGPVDPGAA